jgi:hypothetical protein
MPASPSTVDLIRALIASGLAAALVAPAPAFAAEPPPQQPGARQERPGARQEIVSARTEYDTVYANPTGTVTRVSSAVPVRVHRAGAWRGIDTTLEKRADGTVGPRATVLDVAFSGGGAQPLVTVAHGDGVGGDGSITLAAPWRLPEPRLAGDTATYPDVLPGVDLAMKAEAEGYREVLIVKNRAAAAGPGLRELTFALKSEGVTVRRTAGGGLVASDRSGAELFTAPPPTMWDSSSAATPDQTGAGTTSISGPVEGDQVKAMPLALAAGALRVSPDTGLLTSPTTRFPVFIDPAMGATRTQWAMVNRTYPTTSYYKWGNGSDDSGEGMGYVSTAADGTHLKRLYYTFNTSNLRVTGRTIVSAKFRAFQTWSYNCTAAGVEAWLTNGYTSSLNWNNQPSWVGPHTQRNAPKYGRPDCTPGGAWVDFDVRNQVIASQLKSWSTTTIGLKATNEASSPGWRRFKNNATLEIEYNTYPNVPASRQMISPTTSCGGNVPRGDLPIMQTTVSDPDPGDQVAARFQIFRSGQSTPFWTKTTNLGATGVTYREQMPALTDGMWTWRAQSIDKGGLESAWTGLCNVTVDGSAPVPPLIWFHGGDLSVGGDLDFQFTTGGSPDVVSYRWSVNSDVPTSAPVNVFDGHAKVRVDEFGPFTIRVWSYDAAGNRGASAAWPPEDPLIIGATDVLDWWRMNEAAGTSAGNLKRAGNPLAFSGTVGWEADSWADSGASVALGASTAGVAGGGGGPARGGHFTASAWLKTSTDGGTGKRVAVSQDDGTNASFTLSVERNAGETVDRIVATLYKPDGTVGLRVPSSLEVEPGQWVHATMTRTDQPDGTVVLGLWVTDPAAGETIANQSTDEITAGALASSPTGAVRVGAERRAGAPANFFRGAVDEVVTAQGPFDDQQRNFWRKPVI